MKASIVIELLTKGLDKARSTEKAIKQIGRAAGGAERDAAGLARAESRIGDAGNRAAAGQNRFAASIHKSSDEMRRAKTEAQAYERQMERLGRQRARMPHGNPNAAGLGGMGAVSGVGMAFLGGLGLGVGGVAGAGYVAKETFQKAGEIEFARDQLQVLGEYSDEQAALYDKILKPAGIDRGVGTIGAYGVFGNLMAGGLNADNAAKMTDDVMVFAKATQSATDDAAKTTVALQNNMKVGAKDMMAAFDSMALAGKEGQFEVRDMARSAPSIFARMGKLGETGLQGVRGFAAMAQAIRTTAGTSDEAATNFENMLDKFTAKEFIDNAAEMGVNVQETFATANKQGLSPVLELLKKIKSASGGDAFKLKELMPDVQANAALSSLIDKIPELAAAIERYGNSAGTVAKDFTTATGNMQTAWDRMAGSIGDKATRLADKTLPSIAKAMNGVTVALEDSDARSSGAQAVSGGDPEIERNTREEFIKRYNKGLEENGESPGFFDFKAGNAYLDALKSLGKGEIGNIMDPIQAMEDRLKSRKLYLDKSAKPSVGRQNREFLGVTGTQKPIPSPRAQNLPAEKGTTRWFKEAYQSGNGREQTAQATERLNASIDAERAAHQGVVDAYRAYGQSRIIGKSRTEEIDNGSVSARPHQRAQLQDSDDGSVSLRPEQRQAFAIPPLDGDPLADGMREGGQKAEMAAKATSAAIEATLSAIPLFGAGLKAGMQFAEGLKASAASVAAAANAALVAPVANRVPQSPAKIGPLRNLPSMGRKIAEQLAGGIAGETSPAEAAHKLAGDISSAATAAVEFEPKLGLVKDDQRQAVAGKPAMTADRAVSANADAAPNLPTIGQTIADQMPRGIRREVKPVTDRRPAFEAVPPAIANRAETRTDIVAPEMIRRDPVEQTRRDRSGSAASRGLDRSQTKPIEPNMEAVRRDNPADAARRLAALISERPKEMPAQRQAASLTVKGKPVSVTIGSIVLNGVKDAAAGVGKIGVMLERQLAGTVGDVGAG